MEQSNNLKSVAKAKEPGVSLALVEDDPWMGRSDLWGDGFFDFHRSVRWLNSPRRLDPTLAGKHEDGFYRIQAPQTFR